MTMFRTLAAIRMVAVAGVFALFIPAAAQTAVPQDDRAPLQIEVKELQIPVIVRDAGGKEARDLTQANFHVFDEGKLRTITGFSVLHSASAQSLTQPASQTNT